MSAEARQKISDWNRANAGRRKPLTPEQRQHIRDGQQASARFHAAAEARRGWQPTPEQRQRNSEAQQASEKAQAHLGQLADSRRGKPRKPFADPVAHSIALSKALKGKRHNVKVKRNTQYAVTPEPLDLGLPQFDGCQPIDSSAILGVASVYAIVNCVNGKAYVGSAVNTGTRWAAHRHRLLNGAHHSIHLQRAWDRYGAEAFSWRLLEVVADHTELTTREQYWIDTLRTQEYERGYNENPNATSALGRIDSPETRAKKAAIWRGRKHSEETRAKMRAANLRKGAKLTEIDVRAIIQRCASGDTAETLAAEYGVTPATIYLIRQGRIWKHITQSERTDTI